MAEYWKSTPRYWCKHCSVYVRDTKLERQNHDATAKHQGAVKRALRDLHRGHEREEREKDRAKREIERLNGVVSGASSSTSSTVPTSSTQSASADGARSRFTAAGVPPQGALTESERKRQAEQLASLGVNLPDEFRRDLAMAGDWQVTTTIVQENPDDSRADANPGATARGIHKRERTEEQVEEDEAVKGLFKKPRRWGRESRTVAGQDGDSDLDALLSGGLTVKKKEEEDEAVKKEQGSGPSVKVEEEQEQQQQQQQQQSPELRSIKKEALDEAEPSPGAPDKTSVATATGGGDAEPGSLKIKTEDGDGGPEPAGEGSAPAAVVFKKRKPKNVRQK